MVGRLISIWEDLFSGALLVSGSVTITLPLGSSWQVTLQKMFSISMFEALSGNSIGQTQHENIYKIKNTSTSFSPM